MRMTWARNNASTQAKADRLHFKLWDFFKMFVTTVICGIAVSAIAAGIALALAHDTYAAASPQRAVVANSGDFKLDVDSAAGYQAYPGMLLIGNGCEGEIVDAAERDWKVTINGKNIDVRVMQTFIVPDGDETAATFNALLPSGARLLRLTAHTNGGLWQGKVFDANAYAALNAADFRRLSRKGILIVQNDDGAISTDAIINIAATELLTVEYTYRIDIDEAARAHDLMVTLVNDSDPSNQTANQRAASGAVWVEWIGRKPVQLVSVPSNTTLETVGPQINGLSWAAQRLNADARFQLAWSM